MLDESAFLRAIHEDHDDTARLAFADWLEERGDRRAAWVRDAEVFRWMGPRAEDPVPPAVRSAVPTEILHRVLATLNPNHQPNLVAMLREALFAHPGAADPPVPISPIAWR